MAKDNTSEYSDCLSKLCYTVLVYYYICVLTFLVDIAVSFSSDNIEVKSEERDQQLRGGALICLSCC